MLSLVINAGIKDYVYSMTQLFHYLEQKLPCVHCSHTVVVLSADLLFLLVISKCL